MFSAAVQRPLPVYGVPERVIIVNAEGTKILPVQSNNVCPMPDLTVEFSGDLRYREVRVYDSKALLAPAVNRIGRHVSEVLVSEDLTELYRAVDVARRERRAVHFKQAVRNARYWITVIAPLHDAVVVTVRRV